MSQQQIVDQFGNPFLTAANPGLMLLTGRNVELVQTPFNALAITDALTKFGGTVVKANISKYKELFLAIYCSLDNVAHTVNPTIRIYDGGGGFVPAASKALTDYTGSSQLLTKTDLLPLQVPGVFDFTVSIQCTNAPTSGSVTIYVYGIPN